MEKTTKSGALWSVLLAQYCSGDQIEKNKMDGHVARMGGRGEMYTGFWWGYLIERDHLEDLGTDGGNIKMNIQ